MIATYSLFLSLSCFGWPMHAEFSRWSTVLLVLILPDDRLRRAEGQFLFLHLCISTCITEFK